MGKDSILYDWWAEVLFFGIMIVGVLLALFARNIWLSFVYIFIAGFIAGRLIYEGETRLGFPHYMIILGFLLGFLIGAYYTSRVFLILLYIIGTIIGNYIFKKGIIKDIRF